MTTRALTHGVPAAHEDSVRIARIGTAPRRDVPGMGLPAYKMTEMLGQPTLWITPRHPSPPVHLPDDVRLVEVPFPFVAAPRDRRIPLHHRLRRLAAVSLLNSVALPRLIAYRPHLIHVHSPMYLPAAYAARALLGSPVCLSFHGTDLARVVERRWLRRLVGRADRVLYVASDMAKDLRRFVPRERLVYIANGVDREQFCPGSHAKQQQILAVGSLRWHKGFDVLLDAMAGLDGRAAEWRLVVVGDGPLREQLERRRDALGLAGRVEFRGALQRDALVAVMQESAMFVLSSVTEGFPKVLLEAMACGLPVITTKVGNCAEAAANAGVVVPPGRAAALATAIGRLVDESDLRARMAVAARRRSAVYSWDASVDRTRAAYRELLGEGWTA